MRRIAIVGFGNQGKAWALNLRESGFEVSLYLRPSGDSVRRAKDEGFDVTPLDEKGRAALQAERWIALLIPDDSMPHFAREQGRALGSGQTLIFAHGFALLYHRDLWPADADRILIAPKSPGERLRSRYLEGQSVLTVAAVDHNASGQAESTLFTLAQGLGLARSAIFRASVREEVEANLFSEHVLACGGIRALIRESFDVLARNGVTPEVAYVECVNILAHLTHLFEKQGIARTLQGTSPTARFGGVEGAKRLISPTVRQELERIFVDIHSGSFVRRLTSEAASNYAATSAALKEAEESLLEKTGGRIRHTAGGSA